MRPRGAASELVTVYAVAVCVASKVPNAAVRFVAPLADDASRTLREDAGFEQMFVIAKPAPAGRRNLL